MFKRIFSIVLLCLGLSSAFSQEGLRPLSGRISFKPETAKTKLPTNTSAQKTQAVSLQIPFFDDFYYASTSIHPNTTLWQDSSVYINYGFPIAPPSIGVATFDGLNKFGYPYRPALLDLTQSDSADHLTSQPIDLNIVAATSQTLHLSDSIALSFFYQARGNGETPEGDDSLLLDFYKPRQHIWYNVWGVPGNVNSNTNDTNFKRVFISLTDTVLANNHKGTGDTAYLSDKFQFRFRNKATTAGDFDHWHLDYVYLNKNRSIFDTVYNDITIATVPTPFLKNYSAMPYKQFNASEMAAKNSVRIRNSNSSPVNMFYENKIFTYLTNNLVGGYTGGSYVLAPYTHTAGYSTYLNHSNPPITYTFPAMTTLTDYQIEHYVYRSTGASSDFWLPNDTVIQYQLFRDYYALDDGSAEAGYYINGVGGKIAMKIILNVPDTLQSVQIYFDPVGYGYSDTLSYRFNINVWSAGASGPNVPVYTENVKMYAQYLKSVYKSFPEYKLSAPVILNPGVYYVGIQQRVATGIAVGFDVNTDHHTSVYYDSGGGWTQSGYSGSPMIRPVFGSLHPVGIKENAQDANKSFLIYPNPSSGQFTIYSERFENASYQLMNSLGQKIQEEKISQQEQQVNTSSLSDGIYFLIITNNNRLVQQQKIIIQH